MASTRSSLLAGLARLGVRAGGANVVVQTLLDALGPAGTLAAYVDFEPFYEDDDTAEVPVFDQRIARAARDHGILHETIRTRPGALRSDHPDAGVAADHPLQYGYGPGTPFAKIRHANAQVLLLGAPLDTITLLHYAEHEARIAADFLATGQAAAGTVGAAPSHLFPAPELVHFGIAWLEGYFAPPPA